MRTIDPPRSPRRTIRTPRRFAPAGDRLAVEVEIGVAVKWVIGITGVRLLSPRAVAFARPRASLHDSLQRHGRRCTQGLTRTGHASSPKRLSSDRTRRRTDSFSGLVWIPRAEGRCGREVPAPARRAFGPMSAIEVPAHTGRRAVDTAVPLPPLSQTGLPRRHADARVRAVHADGANSRGTRIGSRRHGDHHEDDVVRRRNGAIERRAPHAAHRPSVQAFAECAVLRPA